MVLPSRDLRFVQTSVARHRGDPTRLVQILWDVQDAYDWLPEPILGRSPGSLA